MMQSKLRGAGQVLSFTLSQVPSTGLPTHRAPDPQPFAVSSTLLTLASQWDFKLLSASRPGVVLSQGQSAETLDQLA